MTVKDAAKGNGYVPFLYSGSIKQAEEAIMSDEKLVFAGIYNIYVIPIFDGPLNLKIYNFDGKNAGVLSITNKRVFFCNSGLRNGNPPPFPLEEIQSIDEAKSLGIGRLRIKGATLEIVVDGNSKKLGKIRQALEKAISTSNTISPNDNANESSRTD